MPRMTLGCPPWSRVGTARPLVVISSTAAPGWKSRDQIPCLGSRFPDGSAGEESACDAEDTQGRPPGEGKRQPPQYSYPKSPTGGGAWRDRTATRPGGGSTRAPQGSRAAGSWARGTSAPPSPPTPPLSPCPGHSGGLPTPTRGPNEDPQGPTRRVLSLAPDGWSGPCRLLHPRVPSPPRPQAAPCSEGPQGAEAFSKDSEHSGSQTGEQGQQTLLQSYGASGSTPSKHPLYRESLPGEEPHPSSWSPEWWTQDPRPCLPQASLGMARWAPWQPPSQAMGWACC